MAQPKNKRTSRDIAELIGGRLSGSADIEVTGFAALEDAGPEHVSFLGHAKYTDQVLPSKAGVVLVPDDYDVPVPEGRAWIHCKDPSALVTPVALEFAPPPVEYPPARHRQACIHPTAVVAESAHIGPFAVIEEGVTIGERTVIGAGAYIGMETSIGDDCLIYPNVSIRERSLLGSRIIIHSGATIGGDGFGFVPGKEGHRKIPQVGIVQIDDDVEIGAQVGIDRARFGRTWIQRGAKIDNLVQIGHNVVVGEHCFIVSQAGIAGSTRIGKHVVIAGQVGIAGHLKIGDGAVLLAQSGIPGDVPPGKTVFGSPAVEKREYARTQLHIQRIPKLTEQIKTLQREVEELKRQLGQEKSSS